MASTLPNATVEVGTPQSVAILASIVSLQAAVAAAIATHSKWEVKTNGLDYLVLGPIAGQPLANMRLLLTFSATKTINAAQRKGNSTGLADMVHAGISYDSGAADITNPWDGEANPFGAANFSGFIPCCAAVTTNAIAQVLTFALDGEVLDIFLQKTTIAHYHVRAGAGLAQPDDAVATGTPPRLYLVVATGVVAVVAAWLNSATGFLGYHSGANCANMIALDPTAVAWVNAIRSDDAIFDVVSAERTYGDGTSYSGLLHVQRQDATRALGWLRNMRAVVDKVLGTTVNDATGSPIGVAFGYSTTVAADTVGLISGAP